jgi:hypothetical protein
MKKVFTSLAMCAALLATNNLSAQAPIFTDAYATGVTFNAFGGSVNAVTVDNTVFQTGTSSLKIVVPAAGYTGGALIAATPQNLSTYNAVSFWIRASAAKTLNVAGLGNNAAATVFQAELKLIPITTTWTKVIIPIPVPSKLTAETGLFHFAEGSDEGAYTIWLDNIQYENLTSTVVGTPTAAMATETINKSVGDAFTPNGLISVFPVNGVATTLETARAYFTYTSSNTAVATMSALGDGTAIGVGQTLITARLGTINAAGTLTVNVAGASAPTTAAPTPTRLPANVLSLFSKAPYANVAGTDWFPNWGQTTVVADVVIAGDTMKKMTNFNYQGAQFANPLNVSTMNSLHLDIWTPNVTRFEVFLINISPLVEQAVALTPTQSGWNSFDIPMSSYTNINKTNVGQFKFVATPSGGTVYLDNIYFWKNGVGTNEVTVAKNLFKVLASVADASLSIDLTENAKGTTEISLTNLSGQMVYNKTMTTNGAVETHNISTKNLAAGIYIVNVRVGNTIQSEKTVITH